MRMKRSKEVLFKTLGFDADSSQQARNDRGVLYAVRRREVSAKLTKKMRKAERFAGGQ